MKRCPCRLLALPSHSPESSTTSAGQLMESAETLSPMECTTVLTHLKCYRLITEGIMERTVQESKKRCMREAAGKEQGFLKWALQGCVPGSLGGRVPGERTDLLPHNNPPHPIPTWRNQPRPPVLHIFAKMSPLPERKGNNWLEWDSVFPLRMCSWAGHFTPKSLSTRQ